MSPVVAAVYSVKARREKEFTMTNSSSSDVLEVHQEMLLIALDVAEWSENRLVEVAVVEEEGVAKGAVAKEAAVVEDVASLRAVAAVRVEITSKERMKVRKRKRRRKKRRKSKKSPRPCLPMCSKR
jgi:hypothetical protein